MIFPAILNPAGGVPGADAVQGREAACYNHDAKPAVSACDHCGRFLCSLCELLLEGRTYCPDCVGKLDRQGNLKTLKHNETLHDSIAASMSIWPLLIWPFTIITAPLTLVYICKYWSTPRQSIYPRRRWRFYMAGALALATCAGWLWLISMLVGKVVLD